MHQANHLSHVCFCFDLLVWEQDRRVIRKWGTEANLRLSKMFERVCEIAND